MSRAMNQKALKKKKKNKKANNSQRTGLPVVEEEVIEEELTFGDKLLAAITPYLGTIVFAVVAGFLAFALVAFLLRSSADSKAFEWRELSSASSVARQSGNISEWNRIAEKYPDSKAGLWAAQFAGDYQLREGLSKLASDQKAGFGMIEKSKEFFQSVIDAPASAKTAMLDQRSHFSLAYAHESLGEFDKSKVLYEKLIEEAPESAFIAHARRGLHRSTSGDYSDLYAKFTNWQEEEIGEAPGPRTPDLPDIDFPEVPEATPATSEAAPEVSGGAAPKKVVNEFVKPADTAAGKSTTVEGSNVPVETTTGEVITKPAQNVVVEQVDKAAQPVVTEVVGEAGSAAKPVADAVKEAAATVKDAAGAVKEAVVPSGK